MQDNHAEYVDDVDATDDKDLIEGSPETQFSDDPLRRYLEEINKVPTLTANEEIDLAKQMEAGMKASEQLAAADAGEIDLASSERERLEAVKQAGQDAKKQLIETNLRLVIPIAKRYMGRGVPFLDLIEEGNYALIRAVEKFDYTKGARLSDTAPWWIRQAIARVVSHGRTPHIPLHMVKTINKLVSTQRRLLHEKGREPTPEEVSAEMGLPPERIIEIQEFFLNPISVEAPADEDDSRLADFIEDDSAAILLDAEGRRELQEQVKEILDGLNERDRRVIMAHFGLEGEPPRPLDMVDGNLQVSRERIRQIEAKIRAKLRQPSQEKKPKDHLDD